MRSRFSALFTSANRLSLSLPSLSRCNLWAGASGYLVYALALFVFCPFCFRTDGRVFAALRSFVRALLPALIPCFIFLLLFFPPPLFSSVWFLNPVAMILSPSQPADEMDCTLFVECTGARSSATIPRAHARVFTSRVSARHHQRFRSALPRSFPKIFPRTGPGL